MVNEKEFFEKLEQLKKKDSVSSKLKEYEGLIRTAVLKKYPIKHIQKALKEVAKIKVSEYALKKFIAKELKMLIRPKQAVGQIGQQIGQPAGQQKPTFTSQGQGTITKPSLLQKPTVTG